MAKLWDKGYQTTVSRACAHLTLDLTPDERAQYGIAGTAPTCPGK